MKNQKIIIAIIIIVVVVGLVIVSFKLSEKKLIVPLTGKTEESTGLPEFPVGEEPTDFPVDEEPIEVPPEASTDESTEILSAELMSGEPALEIPSWQNPESPKQSSAMKESEIPKEAIKLKLNEGSFSPSTFEVKKGQTVTVAVVSEDGLGHTFRFRDVALADVVVTVAPGQIRVVTFYAPSKAGEYEFYCSMRGHEARGEKGKMIVK